eukprot:TRINITY_DN25351_c0_g1_i1.p1 TRINITY_DN25351_c0_g1~~TRINITY_DN25351_c0_g1_i1.p1  ORF type:complete len:486 (-),score=163.13 TRINITY_DN25351_c0_g1_i1:18-1475(-)
MECTISGEVPTEPVTTSDGYVFEKRIIQKYIEEHGKHPISGEPLSSDQLIIIKGANVVKPRPANATSIPCILQMLQNEYDALSLEAYTVRQNNETLRQELSHTLYQHDASCRVVARLMKERDDARAELASYRASGAAPADTSAPGVSEELVGQMTALSSKLSKARKKRVVSETIATKEDIAAFKVQKEVPLHKASNPGITDMVALSSSVVATSGMDGDVVVFDHVQNQIRSTLRGHAKAVTSIDAHPDASFLLSASNDRTMRLWVHDEGDYKPASVFRTHKAAVSSVDLHPLHSHAFTASEDGSWAFHDLPTGTTLTQIEVGGGAPFSAAASHPYGLIYATGTRAGDAAAPCVRVWDVKSQENAATFEGHKGDISRLAFSNNGLYLASADIMGEIKLWDLRKLTNFKTLRIDSGAVSALTFDSFDQYLAVGAKDGVHVFANEKKEWPIVQTFKEARAPVTGLIFGSDARGIMTASMDRNFRILAA